MVHPRTSYTRWKNQANDRVLHSQPSMQQTGSVALEAAPVLPHLDALDMEQFLQQRLDLRFVHTVHCARLTEARKHRVRAEAEIRITRREAARGIEQRLVKGNATVPHTSQQVGRRCALLHAAE